MNRGLKIEPDIFSYEDFRSFIKDRLSYLKNKEGMSLRHVAGLAGLKAPGYFKMVIDGVRNLKPDTITQFAKALKLSKKEKAYFLVLVPYNQTLDPNIKKGLFDDLVNMRPRSEEYLKEKRESHYFSRPYFAAIREMVALKDFREDSKWIAKRLGHSISPSQAREAIDTLLELHLLQRNQDGHLVQSESIIQTSDRHNQNAATYHYHEAMLDKARFALADLKQDERHYYALTLPLPKVMEEEILKKMHEFRDWILQKANEQKQFDDVYQVNIQFFPVTRKIAEPSDDT